jgi:putative ABC transport system permease protein
MLVIGVLEEKIKTEGLSLSNYEEGFNNVIAVPVTVFRRIWGNQGGYYQVLANVKSIELIEEARQRILKVLTANHGKWDERYNKFFVMSMNDQLEMINGVIEKITLGVAILAGIALLVAAIGIMNIMLVSVKERTREIGIRKALGAKRDHILMQFLIETILQCGGGGLIGLGVAYLAAYIIAELAHWPAVVHPMTGLLAMLLAMVTGLLSGLFPASRAANLPPQEALRYE